MGMAAVRQRCLRRACPIAVQVARKKESNPPMSNKNRLRHPEGCLCPKDLSWVAQNGLFLLLHADDHHFGGLNQSGRFVADFQAHFANGVRRNNGGDFLAANGKCHLGDQSVHLNFVDASGQLIAAADLTEIGDAFPPACVPSRCRNLSVFRTREYDDARLPFSRCATFSCKSTASMLDNLCREYSRRRVERVAWNLASYRPSEHGSNAIAAPTSMG